MSEEEEEVVADELLSPSDPRPSTSLTSPPPVHRQRRSAVIDSDQSDSEEEVLTENHFAPTEEQLAEVETGNAADTSFARMVLINAEQRGYEFVAMRGGFVKKAPARRLVYSDKDAPQEKPGHAPVKEKAPTTAVTNSDEEMLELMRDDSENPVRTTQAVDDTDAKESELSSFEDIDEAGFKDPEDFLSKEDRKTYLRLRRSGDDDKLYTTLFNRACELAEDADTHVWMPDAGPIVDGQASGKYVCKVALQRAKKHRDEKKKNTHEIKRKSDAKPDGTAPRAQAEAMSEHPMPKETATRKRAVSPAATTPRKKKCDDTSDVAPAESPYIEGVTPFEHFDQKDIDHFASHAKPAAQSRKYNGKTYASYRDALDAYTIDCKKEATRQNYRYCDEAGGYVCSKGMVVADPKTGRTVPVATAGSGAESSADELEEPVQSDDDNAESNSDMDTDTQIVACCKTFNHVSKSKNADPNLPGFKVRNTCPAGCSGWRFRLRGSRPEIPIPALRTLNLYDQLSSTYPLDARRFETIDPTRILSQLNTAYGASSTRKANPQRECARECRWLLAELKSHLADSVVPVTSFLAWCLCLACMADKTMASFETTDNGFVIGANLTENIVLDVLGMCHFERYAFINILAHAAKKVEYDARWEAMFPNLYHYVHPRFFLYLPEGKRTGGKVKKETV